MYCISIIAILLYILCLPVRSTDTSTELYAGIFRGFGNRIEKSVFPATPFRIIHFLKRLFGAIWLFETRFRAWNNFYMDHSTDTPTHPSTQYRNALGIRSRTTSRITRTTSRITRTTSYMHLESVSSSLWRNSVTSENQLQPLSATPKKAAGFVFAFLTCSSYCCSMEAKRSKMPLHSRVNGVL